MKKLLLLILCLIALTACSPRQVVRTEYLTTPVPELPAAPLFWPVVWIRVEGGICFDEDNAKNLIKNIEVLLANRDELQAILQDLKKEADGHNRQSANKGGE